MKKTGLISVGAVAIIAGCGGGGGGGSALPHQGAAPPTGPQANARLTIMIPARGSKAARRNPKWISPGSTTLGVRVLTSPAPNPTPTEQVFTLPTPGPMPTSVTVTVTAPGATDTFIATAYDTNHNALSTGTSTPVPITFGSPTPTVTVSMLGVANGVQYTVAGNTPAAWRVLENLGAAQTASVNAQPVDADGNYISGSLAIPVSLTTTGAVTLSPATITAMTQVTATYPSGSSGSGSLTTSLASNAGASALNATVNADYYIFAVNADGTEQVIDGLNLAQVGAPLAGPGSGAQMAALSGCAGGAFAVFGNSSGATLVSVAAPTTANPTPLPTATSLPAGILATSPFWFGASADSQCGVYYNGSGAGNPVTKLTGFDSTITANPTFASGFQYNVPMRTIGTQLYEGANISSTQYGALFVPLASGGAAMNTATYTTSSMLETLVVGNGSNVYLVADTCSGQPMLQPLSGGSAITLSQFETFPGGVFDAAQSTDGNFYLVGLAQAAGNGPVLSYGTIGNIGSAPTIALGGTPVGVAVTPDQKYVCVLEYPNSTSGQIEIFSRTASPSLVTTVPLSASQEPVSFSIGP